VRYVVYEAAAGDCSTCSLKPRCTLAQKRSLSQHLYEYALNRMHERVTPAVMRLRRCTAEHPFATIKYRIFGHPRLLMRGLSGARVEIGLATMAYNIKRDERTRRYQTDGSALSRLMRDIDGMQNHEILSASKRGVASFYYLRNWVS
jgi:hypothetical protein